MTTPRERFAHVRLADGHALVAGGNNPQGASARCAGSVEIYDLSTATRTATAPADRGAHEPQRVTPLLASGKVLVLAAIRARATAAPPAPRDLRSGDRHLECGGADAGVAHAADGDRGCRPARCSSSADRARPFMGGNDHALLYDPVANAWQATRRISRVKPRRYYSANLCCCPAVFAAGGGNALTSRGRRVRRNFTIRSTEPGARPMLTTSPGARGDGTCPGEVLLTGGLMPVSSDGPRRRRGPVHEPRWRDRRRWRRPGWRFR